MRHLATERLLRCSINDALLHRRGAIPAAMLPRCPDRASEAKSESSGYVRDRALSQIQMSSGLHLRVP